MPAPNGDECSRPLDYFVPPAKYEDGDLYRAIVADAKYVYFRNMKQVFRLPLSGGKPEVISEAPGLSLSGRTVLFESGDRLLSQSSNEPIFMASPKSGGPWSDFINLSPKKVAGGRNTATRVLQGLGSAQGSRSSQAAFDGDAFYWADNKLSRGHSVAASATLRSVSLNGGDAKDLYQAPGDIGEVTKASGRVVFMHTAPPAAREKDPAGGTQPRNALGERGQQRLMSVAVAGGEAKELARISNFIANVVLGSDGIDVYVSGYPNGDLTKPGIYRVSVESGGLESIDRRALHGQAFAVGNRVIIAGSGQVDAEQGKLRSGQVVLAIDRGGKATKRIGCVADGYTSHAYAIAGQYLLMSLFKSDGSVASIAKFKLPQ